MKDIKSLLEKFNFILGSSEVKRDAVKNAILEVSKIDIPKENIEIKRCVAYLNVKPIIKSEIVLKKETILSVIEKYLGFKKIEDIK